MAKRAVRPAVRPGRVPMRRSVVTPDKDITLLQQDISAAFEDDALGTPWAVGRVIELNFTASTLQQTVPTLLDGEAKGFVVVDKNAAEHVYRLPTTLTQKATHVRLVATGAVVAKVWVWR